MQKKSQATMPSAWAWRNSRQVGAARRPRQSGVREDPPHRRRGRDEADAFELADDPQVAAAWILPREAHYEVAQVGVDSGSAAPVVRLCPAAADKFAVPRSSVSGVTISPDRRAGAISRASAARYARSDQRSRGRGFDRRSTASSRRSTSSSASHAATSVPRRATRPRTATNARVAEGEEHPRSLAGAGPTARRSARLRYWHPSALPGRSWAPPSGVGGRRCQ